MNEKSSIPEQPPKYQMSIENVELGEIAKASWRRCSLSSAPESRTLIGRDGDKRNPRKSQW